MIVGVDAGNNEVKVMGPLGLDIFKSSIGEYAELDLSNGQFGKDDMVFKYKDRKGLAGSLAYYESDFGGSIMGESKAHEDALIRILLALHRYGNSSNYEIITGQPISSHTVEEKQAIKDMLIDKHTITVNGKTRTFSITRCEVAAEGIASFWSSPVDGLIRIIDVGSATVNCASIIDKKNLNKGSFTIPLGMETVRNKDLNELARGLYTQTSKRWKKEDTVLVMGGAAERLLEPIKKYYPYAELIKPSIRDGGSFKIVKPIYANAIGFYNLGRALYER